MQQQPTEPSFARRPLLRLAAALTLLGAAVIHVTQIGIHLDEWAAAGVFFIVLAVGQGLLGIALLVRDTRALSIATVVLSLVAIAVWATSRTTGIPFGPGAGVAEPVERSDSLATLFEAVTILTLVPLLRFHPRRETSVSLRGPRYAAVALLSVPIAALTTYAIQPVEGCGHHGEGNKEVAQQEPHHETSPGKRLRQHAKGHDDHERSPDSNERSHKPGRGDAVGSEEADDC